jgi:hypothetical protein
MTRLEWLEQEYAVEMAEGMLATARDLYDSGEEVPAWGLDKQLVYVLCAAHAKIRVAHPDLKMVRKNGAEC